MSLPITPPPPNNLSTPHPKQAKTQIKPMQCYPVLFSVQKHSIRPNCHWYEYCAVVRPIPFLSQSKSQQLQHTLIGNLSPPNPITSQPFTTCTTCSCSVGCRPCISRRSVPSISNSTDAVLQQCQVKPHSIFATCLPFFRFSGYWYPNCFQPSSTRRWGSRKDN